MKKTNIINLKLIGWVFLIIGIIGQGIKGQLAENSIPFIFNIGTDLIVAIGIGCLLYNWGKSRSNKLHPE